MDNIRLLLKYIGPYKWHAITNVLYNILSALFALFTYNLVIPFLNILFDRVHTYPHPGEFHLNLSYLNAAGNYYFSGFIKTQGTTRALLLVCVLVVIASLLKNGFIFLSNNSMAYIRSYTVRDLRRKLYHKVLRLPLSYYTDARKGDVMTRISNDVQEVEISVMASLTMLFVIPYTFWYLLSIFWPPAFRLHFSPFCFCLSADGLSGW